MKEFHIDRQAHGPAQVIKLSGALDMHFFPRLEEEVKALFQQGQYRLVLDCRDLDYISSAGLGMLIGFARQAREHDGDVKLLNVPEHILKIIELLGFTKVLSTFTTLELALASFPKK